MVGPAPLNPQGLVLLADDLTGACDVGAAAMRRGWRVRCILASASGWQRAARPRSGEAVVIDLETRRLPRGAAVHRAGRVVRWLRRHRMAPTYFKIDSTLRGHPVAEAAAVRSAGRLGRIWFVPANPAMGRTIQDGRLLVGGVPVERSVFARDPLHPVATGDLKVLTRPLRAGAGCEIPDAATDGDLRRIARDILPGDFAVGAAALAQHVIRPAGRRGRLRPGKRSSGRRSGPARRRVLAVIGSMNPVTAAQVRRAGGAELVQLGPRDLRIPVNYRFGSAGGLSLVTLDPAKFRTVLGGSPARRRIAGERVARDLARIAAGITRRWRPSTLLLSGGLTAATVCEALRVRSLTLVRETAPGVVLSEAVWPGGRARFLTKPGGFGGPDVLRALARA